MPTSASACPDCGGMLKPDVVFFGILVEGSVLPWRDRRARGLLVVGSSPMVYSVSAVEHTTSAASR